MGTGIGRREIASEQAINGLSGRVPNSLRTGNYQGIWLRRRTLTGGNQRTPPVTTSASVSPFGALLQHSRPLIKPIDKAPSIGNWFKKPPLGFAICEHVKCKQRGGCCLRRKVLAAHFVVFAIDLTHCSSPFELSHQPVKSIGIEQQELSRRNFAGQNKETPPGLH
jgi:hypothetical protein